MNEALELVNSVFMAVAAISITLFSLAWVTLLPSLGLLWILGWL